MGIAPSIAPGVDPGLMHGRRRGLDPTATGRWYDKLSAWNAPIPPGTPIHPGSAAMISAGNTLTNATFPQYSAPLTWCLGPTNSGVPSLWIANQGDPSLFFWINNPNVSCHSGSLSVRAPANLSVEAYNGGNEPSSCIIDAVTGIEYDLYKPSPPGAAPINSSPALNCATDPANWSAPLIAQPGGGWKGLGDYLSGSFYRASKTPAGAGTIRYRDAKRVDAVGWDHALALSYPLVRKSSDTVPFVYPAGATDGDHGVFTYSFADPGEAACIPMGARVQLDPSINLDTHPDITNYQQRQLAKTLQKYGFIVVDTGGALVTEQTTSVTTYENGTYNFPWDSGAGSAKLPPSLAAQLRVIDWTQWTH